MKNKILMRTNVLICAVILAGFLVTTVLSYQANYSASLESIEQVSTLTSEGIFYQLSALFSRPVNVSLTMANDSLLKEYLAGELSHLRDDDYTQALRAYLEGYQRKYAYDSVFLVSTATGRYYNFSGIDRVLTPDNPENVWYYSMLEQQNEYLLVVDNDEVSGADNAITVFVNCKIFDGEGDVMGVVGVGMRIDMLQALLLTYEQDFGGKALLVDETGAIEIATDYTGYEKVDYFDVRGLNDVREKVLGWQDEGIAQSFWTKADNADEDYIVARYIPELSWHLIVERDTSLLLRELRGQLYRTAAIIACIIATILFVITYVIRGFNRQITRLTQERAEMFRNATEELYDNIYEIDVTHNRAAGKSTERYFESLGVPKDTPYDQALAVIAQKQIKEEHRQGYLTTFSPQNVISAFESGNAHLQYDFMISQEGSDYFWMRIDAHIYISPVDQSLRMYTYHKNIDAEKRRGIEMVKIAQTDAMTGLYNKAATRAHIERLLAQDPHHSYGFVILDIDNFKDANDRHGHAFGDSVIVAFSETIRRCFQEDDVVGRIGGDEFVVFIPIPNETWVKQKAEALCAALSKAYTMGAKTWQMSASIGIAISPAGGTDFDSLYRHADTALYQTKKRGKGGYTLYEP